MSYFLKLPAELRNQIYRQLYYDPSCSKCFLTWSDSTWQLTYFRRKDVPIRIDLLLVCRQFHEEIASLFYGETVFSGDVDPMLAFLKQIGPQNCRSLTSISLNIPWYKSLPDAYRVLSHLAATSKQSPLKFLGVKMPEFLMMHEEGMLYPDEAQERTEDYNKFCEVLNAYEHTDHLEVQVAQEPDMAKIDKNLHGWNSYRQVEERSNILKESPTNVW
jgi:hypothetical protein